MVEFCAARGTNGLCPDAAVRRAGSGLWYCAKHSKPRCDSYLEDTRCEESSVTVDRDGWHRCEVHR